MALAEWRPLGDDDLPALTELALACLKADGGLPMLADEPMLRRLFLSGEGVGGRDETGDLVAAAALRGVGAGRPWATGLVRPSARHRGLGRQLIAWVVEHSEGAIPAVAVETSSPDTEAFLRHLGLTRTFAEHVMRHDLVSVPTIPRPRRLVTLPWTDDTAPLFFRAYRGSFADRPGFPDPPLEEWVEEVAQDPDFRPEVSRVVLDRGGHVAGFITVTDDWVDQVGVLPEWRGRALGAHLVARALRNLRRAGSSEAWLNVNVDNAARDLYLRLGFTDAGLRSRWEPTG